MAEDSSDSDVLAKIREAVEALADESESDVILYSGGIYPPGDQKLIDTVKAFRKRKNVFLHLTTTGGLPDTAYRIARCLQRAYSGGTFTLFVDTECKSAGTMIALGADEIVMSVTAELGPLDVQVSKPDALAEQTSGLTPTQAINTLRDQAFDAMEMYFLKLRFKSGLQTPVQKWSSDNNKNGLRHSDKTDDWIVLSHFSTDRSNATWGTSAVDADRRSIRFTAHDK